MCIRSALLFFCSGFVESQGDELHQSRAIGSVMSTSVNGLSTDPNVPRVPPFPVAGGGWPVANFACQANACTAPFEVDDFSSTIAGLQQGGNGALAFHGIVYLAA